MSEEQRPIFGVEKLYVKDFSLEVPNAPEIFLEQEAPEVDIQLYSEGRPVEEGVYEVVLTVTVTAKRGDKTYFLVEVGQGGIFQIRNVPQEDMEPLMAIACPNLLFPYAREAVANATTRAGFSPVVLQPVSFESLYMARKQSELESQGAGAPHEITVQ